MTSRIVEAAIAGDAEQVLRLANSNPFIPNSSMVEPALLSACEFGQLAVVKTCLNDLKCNPNCVDKAGRSPLHMAVVRKNGKVVVSIINFLSQKGAKIRKSVLHVCANEFAVFPLIELGADINAASVDGLTPLSVAVSNDRQEVVSELIRAKCFVSQELIFRAKSASVVHMLVRAGLDVNARDSKGLTPLQNAVNANDKKLARSLLEAKADPSSASRTPSVASCDESSIPSAKSSGEHLGVTVSLLLEKTNALSHSLSRLMDDEAELAKSTSAQFSQLINLHETFSHQIKKVSLLASAARKKFENNLCVICQSEPRSVVLMPCKHLCCCRICTESIMVKSSELQSGLCPVCRTQVRDTVTVYT